MKKRTEYTIFCQISRSTTLPKITFFIERKEKLDSGKAEKGFNTISTSFVPMEVSPYVKPPRHTKLPRICFIIVQENLKLDPHCYRWQNAICNTMIFSKADGPKGIFQGGNLMKIVSYICPICLLLSHFMLHRCFDPGQGRLSRRLECFSALRSPHNYHPHVIYR